MEWWIVAGAVVGGVAGWLAGYNVGFNHGFDIAKNHGFMMLAHLASYWGKSPTEVEKAMESIRET